MLDKFTFYTQHSINDLKVNGQRTFFALLCIAAGVAAIVSLQTLAIMIGDTLTENLQANNRGDIQIETLSANGIQRRAAILQQATEDGALSGSGIAFGGASGTVYTFTEDGIDAVRNYLNTTYGDQVQVTYRQTIGNPLNILTGSGPGTLITVPETDYEANQLSPILVEADVYPFYSDIVTLDGQPLADVLNQAGDVVLAQSVADILEVTVGDIVTIRGATGDFTVTGIVASDAEVRNPTQDIFAALFGFYILDHASITRFENQAVSAQQIFVQTDSSLDVTAVAGALRERFPYIETTTTDDLREFYTELSENLNQLVTVMGLVSLLLGSIGIVNTMQVIVRRRVKEIAVLKTLGLQADQITQLFLLQAFIMGIVGSLGGIFLGWGMTFVIRGVAETVFGTTLPFRIAPEPIIGGLVVGTLVTTVFGFLPTLSAGQIRPGIVLRPSDDPVPRAGCLRSMLALAFIIVALAIIAQSIVGNFFTALAIVFGAFIAAGILYGILLFLIAIVGRLIPSFGVPDIKIAMREMLAQRSRGALTLLALVVGVFSLSLVTLLADSVNQALEDIFLSGDNVIIQVGGGEEMLQTVEGIIQGLEGENIYRVGRTYNFDFARIEKADGQIQTPEDLAVLLDTPDETSTEAGDNVPFDEANTETERTDEAQSAEVADEPQQTRGERRARQLGQTLDSIGAVVIDELSSDVTFIEGRQLQADDAGQRRIVLTQTGLVADAGISVGDTLVFEYRIGGILGFGGTREEINFEVVGLIDPQSLQEGSINFAASNVYAPIDAFPQDLEPSQITISASIQDDQIAALRRQVANLPQTFVLETDTINKLVTTILGQLTTFPILVAALGLVVGGIVIANSVALSTMERKREIAIMKSIGLQRERVLTMLLIENGVLGLIGGLIGVGMSVIALLILLSGSGGFLAIPFGTALILMSMCVLIALVAAITTAWGASGEKPLNVLRYE